MILIMLGSQIPVRPLKEKALPIRPTACCGAGRVLRLRVARDQVLRGSEQQHAEEDKRPVSHHQRAPEGRFGAG